MAAVFEKESFDLYCAYQMAIHKDPPDKLSKNGYVHFLVDSPISVTFRDWFIIRNSTRVNRIRRRFNIQYSIS